jgi:hypothetical protein
MPPYSGKKGYGIAMKIFLSWSGERSRQVALGLREWLPKMFDDLEDPWMSDKDISAGERWAQKLATQLETIDFGILCLTPGNLNVPWLIFEAGAISRAVTGARVVPYLSGLAPEEVPHPLALFQSVRSDEKGSFKLVQSVNAELSDSLSEKDLEESFKEKWPDLEGILERALDAQDAPRDIFLTGFPSGYQNDLKTAEEVWLVGVSLENTVRTYRRTFEKKLESGHKLKVLLANPEASVVKPAVLRKSSLTAVAAGVKQKCAEIDNTLAHLRELREKASKQLEIRTTDYPLAYGVHAMNLNKPNGVLYIKLYPYKVEEEQKLRLVLRANDGGYEAFKQELVALWNDGEPR